MPPVQQTCPYYQQCPPGKRIALEFELLANSDTGLCTHPLLIIPIAFLLIITNQHMKLRIETSSKKSIVEESSDVRDIELRLFDKDSARQHYQVMEEVSKMMKTNLRKESRDSLFRSKASSKNLHRDQQNLSNSRPKEEPLSRMENSKVAVSVSSDVGEAKSETREGLTEEAKKVPYKFSFKSFLIELIVAYAVTFALLYFIKLGNFPYFEMLLILAFTASVSPWRSSNGILLLAIPMVAANFVLKLGYFTYPSIAICYFSVLAFNERHKKKQVFVLSLIFTIVFGFIVLPAIYDSLASSRKVAYVYLFPLMMLLLRAIVSYTFWIIQHTAVVFLQLPLFLTGLEYGTILSQDISTIEFWYLMVFFTIQIMNDRTQFLLRILISITEYCTKEDQQDKDKNKLQKHRVLPAHSNGYACLHSFHLFLLVYIYARLDLFTAPFSSRYSLDKYIDPWYKPLVVWLLSSVYEVLSLILEKRAKHRLLIGFTSNKWWRSVLRGFILCLGMWTFYLGLAISTRIYSIN